MIKPVITIEEAAKYLGMSPQAVRVQMQRGRLPIGTVTKTNGSTRKYTYKVIGGWLERYLEGNPVILTETLTDAKLD